MAIWYLDNDDEITDAVARLRGATDEHIVFVVPPGSRIATGRINFKLLAREAESRALEMAIASPDEQVRALASSAGVLVAATPDEAQAALERGDKAPGPATMPDAPTKSESSPAAAAVGTESRSGFLMWRSQRLRIATVLVLALVVVGVYATQALPTAEITLRPATIALGPVEASVTASTATTEVDAEAGQIPAVAVPIALSVGGAYDASGVESAETLATGEVVFSSPDQEFDQEIVAGTRVHTPAGIEFQTIEAVTLPFSEGSSPAQVYAPVEALASGEDGNVDPEVISVVPSLESQGISVSNPEPTSGGRFEQTPVILAADYDRAAGELQDGLQGELKAYLRDPANTPAGLTLFAETARLGPVGYQPPADELVGSGAPEFTLSGSVAAQVLAVDETLVDEVLRTRLLGALPEDMAVLPGSLSAEHGEGGVEGEHITFSGVATATSYPLIDADELLARIAGLPVSEAQAILEGIGTATVTVWPDFLSDLPADRERITLDVIEASTTE